MIRLFEILNSNTENKLVKRVQFQLIHKILMSSSESIKITQSSSVLNPERAKFLIDKSK